MSFWNNPENNSLKVLLIALIAGVGGGFIYTWMHHDGADTGRLIGMGGAGTSVVDSSTSAASMSAGSGTVGALPTGTTVGTTATGGTSASTAGSTAGSGVTAGGAIQGGKTTMPGTEGGVTEGRDSPCFGIPPVALIATMVPPGPIPTAVYVGPSATSPSAPGHWLNFALRNPTDCPVVVSKATIHLDTNDLTTWPPVQYVKLMHAGTQVGDTLEVPGAGPLTVGPTNLVFVAGTNPFAVTIAPHSAEVFHVTSASQNVDANEYGGATPPSTSATGATIAGTGTPVYFSMQLVEFFNTNAVSSVTNDQIPPSFSSTIVTPHINIYN